MSGEVRIAKVLNCARYSETVWECLLEPGTVLQFSSMSAGRHGHTVSARRLLPSQPSPRRRSTRKAQPASANDKQDTMISDMMSAMIIPVHTTIGSSKHAYGDGPLTHVIEGARRREIIPGQQLLRVELA